MKKRISLFALLVTAGLAWASPKAAVPGKQAVEGRVLGSDGAPLSGAVVTFAPPGQASERLETISDAVGHFTADVPAGEYLFTIARHGYVASEGVLDVTLPMSGPIEVWLSEATATRAEDAPADQSTEARLQLAASRYEEGMEAARHYDRETAIARLRDVLALVPDHKPALTSLGDLLMKTARFDAAQAVADWLLSVDPQSPDGLRLAFMSRLTRTNELSRCEEAFRAWHETDAELSESTLYAEAETRYEAGDADESRVLLETLLRYAPDNADAHYQLGVVLATEDQVRAREHLLRAIALHPKALVRREAQEMLGAL